MSDSLPPPTHEQYLEALRTIAAYQGTFKSNSLFAIGPGHGNPIHYHRHLRVVPRSLDDSCRPHEVEFLDADATPLAVVDWPQAPEVLCKLLAWNSIVPGGATYVIRGSDSLIRRALATQKRLDIHAQETRIDELPRFKPSSAQAKASLGEDILNGISFDDLGI